MNSKRIREISKFFSLILRHEPSKIGLILDKNGWAVVDELLSKASKNRFSISLKELEYVVAMNDKQRFSFSQDKSKIRANQGHSIDIDLELKAVKPPKFLYHGTVTRFINSIKESGLKKMQRQHVHLSEDKETAIKVGSNYSNY